MERELLFGNWAPISEEESRLEYTMAKYKIALETYQRKKLVAVLVSVITVFGLGFAFLVMGLAQQWCVAGALSVIALLLILEAVLRYREANRRLQERRTALTTALEHDDTQRAFAQVYERLTNEHTRQVFDSFRLHAPS